MSTRYHFVIVLYLIVYSGIAGSLYGQAVSPFDYHSAVKSIPSPGAASLGKFGDIPVNLFTGTPNISIPLMNVHYGSIDLPVELSYNASGITVSEQAGWAGLGWSLNPGQISRKVNGIQDEFNNVNGNMRDIDQGYYFTGNSLNTAAWNTAIFMKGILNAYQHLRGNQWAAMNYDGEPDEFQFNFSGYSGSFYRTETNEWKVKSKQNIRLEISHEIWTGYPASYELHGVTNPEKKELVASLFTKFTVITPDGFQYIFGGDSAAIEFSRGQIGPLHQANFSTVQNTYVEDKANYITANTWYLSKIITPSGENITLQYERGLPIFQKSKGFRPAIDENAPNGYQTGHQNVQGVVINPSYLCAIETPLQRISFTSSVATELPMGLGIPFGAGIDSIYFKKSLTCNWADITEEACFNGSLEIFPRFNRQLDSIMVYDKIKGQYLNGYKFYHSASVTQRRTLDSLTSFSFLENHSGKYKFTYNNVANMPPYESYKKDHYGLYNGGYEPSGSTFPNRFPNSAFATYGLIQKIVYPTGGETNFEFEGGVFSKFIKVDGDHPTDRIQLVPAEIPANEAGVRIHKITSKAGYNAPDVSREYFYVNNYASAGSGGISSGIRAWYPMYADVVDYSVHLPGPDCNGSFRAYNLGDDNSEWLSQVHGGYLTYGEVTEKNGDGSFTVHKFSNHDETTYRDEFAERFAYADEIWSGDNQFTIDSTNNYRITSNDLERGNVLSEEYYTSAGVKVKQLNYEYRNAPTRKNEYIKAFGHKELYSSKSCGGIPIASIPRGWTYKIYCYQNPVSKITEQEFSDASIVTKTTNYSYDSYGNKVSTVVSTSDGRRMEEDTKYNSHPDFLNTPVNADAIGVNKLFTQYKIKNYPVEQVTLKGAAYGSTQIEPDNMLTGTLYHYDPDYPLVSKVQTMELAEPFVPLTYDINLNPVYHFSSAKISGGNFTYDSRYKPQMQALSYTASPSTFARKYTALQQNTRKEAYTWDYLTQYTASVTQNAVAADVAFNSFEGSYLAPGSDDDNKGNWIFDKNNIASGGFTGSKCMQVSTSAPITSRYLLTGGRSYRLSFWAKGGVPAVLLNGTALPQSYAALKQASDWSYYSILIVGSGQTVGIRGSSMATMKLDEIRLHPEDARMKSYTFDAATGNPTTITDENGITSFYTYDGLGRLLYIKDEQGNILQKYTYQLQGAE